MSMETDFDFNFETMAEFFEKVATRERMAKSLLKVLAGVDYMEIPYLENDKDLIVQLVYALLFCK